MTVSRVSASGVGQTTLRSSERTSPRNWPTPRPRAPRSGRSAGRGAARLAGGASVPVAPDRLNCRKSLRSGALHFRFVWAGAAGLEPATPGFGDQCSAKLSYAPVYRALPCLSMLGMLATPRAILLKRQPIRIVPPILFGVVAALPTFIAGQRNQHPLRSSGH